MDSILLKRIKTSGFLLLLLIGSFAFGQTTASYSFSDSGAVSGLNEAAPGITVDSNIGFGSFKNSGSSNPSIVSNQLRLYQNATKGGSIKIYASNGVTITEVVVNASGTTGPAGYTVDGGPETTLSASNTYTISGISATSEVEFYQKDSNKSNRIYVDSFDVTYTTSGGDPTGPSIADITQNPIAENVTPTDVVSVSAEIIDTDGIASAKLYWGTTSGSRDHVIDMSNSGNIYTTISSIPAQLDGTTIYYEIEAIDNSAESLSTVSSPLSYTASIPVFPFPYCGPLFYHDVEPITLVNVAGINNITSNVIGGTPAHEDFTAIVGTMQHGSSYTITLKANTGGGYDSRFMAYVDWNQDGDFDDDDEAYNIPTILNNSTGVDSKEVTWTIAVPSHALIGSTRMRVKKQYGDGANIHPCVVESGYGQAEDYTINVLADPAPVIANISQVPDSNSITSIDDVIVSADITDDTGIASAELLWGTVSGLYPNTIAMTLDAGNSYVTTIDALADGTTVYYVISVTDTDTSPNTTISPEHSYTVTDPVPLSLPYANAFANTTNYDDAVGLGFQFTNANQNGSYVLINSGSIVSPAIDFSAYPSLTVSFKLGTYGTGSGAELSVSVSNDNGATYAPLGTFAPTSSTLNSFEQIIDLTSLNGTNGHIKFEQTGGTNSIRFNTLSIEETPTCAEPTALTATNVTSSTADIAWNLGEAETSWDISWGPRGYTPEDVDEVGNETVATPSHQIIDLISGTEYDVYVRASCTESLKSDWVGPAEFTTPEELIVFTSFESSEGLVLGQIDGQKGWTTGTGASTMYTITDEDASNGTQSLKIGINPAASYRTLANSFEEYTTGKVSFSADIKIVDYAGGATEIMAYGGGITTRLSFQSAPDRGIPLSAIVLDHDTAPPGQTSPASTPINENEWFNIDIVYDFVAGNAETVEYFINGVSFYSGLVTWAGTRADLFVFYALGKEEVFIDNIRWGIACDDPTNLVVDTITDETANVSWNEGINNGTDFELIYAEAGFNPNSDGTIISLTNGDTEATLSALTENTEYDVYVRANCSETKNSHWVGPVSFTTLVAPPVNENCDGAIGLICNAEPVTYSSIGSTAVAPSGCNIGTNGIWFSFVGTGYDITIYSTASFDHKMSIQTGSCAELTWINCKDGTTGPESYTLESSVLDQIYYVYIANYTGTITGEITVSIACQEPCTAPTLTLAAQDINEDPISCLETGGEYYVLATLSGGSGNTSYSLTANSETPVEVFAEGSYTFGPYVNGTNVTVNGVGIQDGTCSVSEIISSPINCPPANENCTGAIALVCNAEPVTYSSVGSTAVPPAGCAVGNNGLWFSFVGSGYDITINSIASFDHKMSMQVGSCSELTWIACADTPIGSNTEKSYTVTASVLNQMYYVYIANWSGGSTITGDITIDIDCSAPPECTAPTLTLAAQDINENPITCLESTEEYYVLATLSGGTGNTSYMVSSNGETTVEVDAESSYIFGPYARGSYITVVAEGAQYSSCSVSEGINSPTLCIPSNDDCENAISLSCGDSVTGTTIGASYSGMTDECTFRETDDVFYSLDVVAGDEYTVTVVGTNYDAVLALYSGPCGTQTNIDCADNGSTGDPETITFTALNTETVTIRTYDWDVSAGNFTISVDCTPAISGYVYDNGWLMPLGDPSGVSTNTDDITVINGTASLTANTDVNNITVNSGATLEIYHVLNLNGDLTNDGDLIFVSSATGNGELAPVSITSNIIGDVTVQRYMKDRRSYRMVSSAVTTTTSIHDNWQEGATSYADNPAPGFGTHITGTTSDQFNGFDATITGNSSMFYVPEGTQVFEAIANTNVNTLTAGNPYLLFVRGDRDIDLMDDLASSETILRATGSLVTGMSTQDYPSANANDFVMFGNPYQSAVNINSVFAGSTNFNPNYYYIYDPTLGDFGSYVTVNLPAGGTNGSGSSANQFLQPGQAAQGMVYGAATIVFNESDKAPGNFTSSNANPMTSNDMITVQLYTTQNFNNGGSVHDSFGIIFNEEYDNRLTSGDAIKPMNFYENLGINLNGNYLSIEQREMPQPAEVFTMYSAGYQSSEYTLKVIVDGLDANSFYLNDSFTGASVLLEAGENSYSFSVDANNPLSIATDRFSIHTAQRLGLDDDNLLSGIKLFPNPLNGDTFYINAPKLNGEQLSVSISDLMGRSIYEQTLDCKANTITIPMGSNVASGVYLVTLRNNGNSQTYRLIKE